MMNIINPLLFAGLPLETREKFKSPKPNTLEVKVINRFVEEEFSVSIEDLKSKKSGARKRDERVFPRQIWQYLLKKHTNLILKDIGSITDRDHSTVMHGLKNVSNILETKNEFRDNFIKVIEKAEKL